MQTLSPSPTTPPEATPTGTTSAGTKARWAAIGAVGALLAAFSGLLPATDPMTERASCDRPIYAGNYGEICPRP